MAESKVFYAVSHDGSVTVGSGIYTETYSGMKEVKDRLDFLRRRKDALQAAAHHKGGEWTAPPGMDEETAKMTRANIAHFSKFR